MKKEAFEALAAAEGTWWDRGRQAAVSAILGNSKFDSILDFGAGFGSQYDFLRRYGNVYAFEPDTAARREAGHRGYVETFATLEDASKHSYDCIALFDVLEHIEDDERAAKWLFDALKPGGTIVLTVPAFQRMWSEHDIKHMHYRRYSKERFRRVLENAGFSLQYIGYWNMMSFVPVCVVRFFGGTGESGFRAHPLAQRVARWWLHVEASVLKFAPLPFGLSLVARAQKPSEGISSAHAGDARAKRIVTADDFGLSRGVSDSILETFDRGALARVSVLANGLDFDRAMRAAAERPDLQVAIHFNLTEGTALSPREDVPHLTHPDGSFAHTPLWLFARSIFALPRARARMRGEIALELGRQAARVRAAAHEQRISANGHQHVHMVPLVFGVVADMHRAEAFASVRIPREPLMAPPRACAPLDALRGIMRRCGLYALGAWNARAARRSGIPYDQYFIGAFSSGRLSLHEVRCALAHARGSVEIGIHPGSAAPGELRRWTGDIAWHYSPHRAHERAMLLDPQFRAVLMAPRASGAGRIARFIVVGALAFALNIALLYAFTDIAGIWYLYSAVIAWLCAFAVSFSLQRVWTFGDRRGGSASRQAVAYLALQIGNVVLNTAGMYALVEYGGVWYIAAQALASIAIAVWTYLASSTFVFRHRGAH